MLTWTSFGWLLLIAAVIFSIACSIHALLYRRDYRSTVGWIALLWLVPIIGPVLYLMLGINRINRRAWRRFSPRRKRIQAGFEQVSEKQFSLLPEARHDRALRELMVLGDNINPQPLTRGNDVQMYSEAEDAFAAMLLAIKEARRSVCIATYIFCYDKIGQQFVLALRDAQRRGVEVRVLIDYIGCRMNNSSAEQHLKAEGIPVEYFLPVFFPLGAAHFNLRNHRKLLTTDGCIGFTGGMNITDDHICSEKYPQGCEDVHFRLEGPVVRHFQETFATDWYFTADEVLDGKRWFCDHDVVGDVVARGIAHGPDEAFERLRLLLEGAVSSARHSIQIVTPYFLPEEALIHALVAASLRGVRVELYIPQENDHPMVQWASQTGLWQVMEHGIHVWQLTGCFDHSKLMIVDDEWVLLGSSNWDPRSLRLNFEFNVECYSPVLATQISDLIQAKRWNAAPLTRDDIENRSLTTRLRNGLARLMTPYL
ncbi:MAG TPA: cardiolipin synthase [Gammaproteobacteria bacterium]|nr:cardiolipin synthase [Gammaproteobacteria bacterium]